MVQLAAVGNTIPVALDGAFKLNQLGIPAVAGDIWEAQAAYAFNLGPEDVVLIISNSGSSKRLETLALGAKENGSTLVLITNNRESPLAQICDYKIITATRENFSQRNSGFQSHSHYCDRDHLPSFDGGKEGCG